MCCTWRNSSLMSGRQSELIALHWHSLPGDLTTKKNKKEHFNPTATKGKKNEKKRKTAEEEIGLEPGRVHTFHLDPRLRRYSNAPLKISRFQSIVFKALTFQAVIGYLSIEVF